jgi:co-chaperonin GroES (HSP10)
MTNPQTVTKFKAYRDHILVLRKKISNVTAAGLHIPDSAKEKQDRWEVIDVGPDVHDITVGDFVVYKDSSVFLGGNVLVKDHAVYIDEPNGIIAVRTANIVAVLRKEDL